MNLIATKVEPIIDTGARHIIVSIQAALLSIRGTDDYEVRPIKNNSMAYMIVIRISDLFPFSCHLVKTINLFMTRRTSLKSLS